MIRHDLAHWPLVVTVARGPMSLGEHAAFLAEWTRWLDTGERFAALRLFADAEALLHPDGAAHAAKAWLQANAERIRAQVLGMATIVPVEQFETVSRMNAEKLFGVPARSFASTDEALAWMARTVLASNGIPVNTTAIRSSMLAADLPEEQAAP